MLRDFFKTEVNTTFLLLFFAKNSGSGPYEALLPTEFISEVDPSITAMT